MIRFPEPQLSRKEYSCHGILYERGFVNFFLSLLTIFPGGVVSLFSVGTGSGTFSTPHPARLDTPS